MEYTKGYIADHRCQKGHIVHYLNGEFVSELNDGKEFIIKKGSTYVVSDDLSLHQTMDLFLMTKEFKSKECAITIILDCWEQGKTPNDYNTLFKKWHEKDIRAFVRRDRNHPSVIGWSAGNEVREQGDEILVQKIQRVR